MVGIADILSAVQVLDGLTQASKRSMARAKLSVVGQMVESMNAKLRPPHFVALWTRELKSTIP